MKTAQVTTFKRRQRVEITHAAGRTELGAIVRPDRALAGWYIVRYDDGTQACVRFSSIAAAFGVSP
jgi:hypothetical protein